MKMKSIQPPAFIFITAVSVVCWHLEPLKFMGKLRLQQLSTADATSEKNYDHFEWVDGEDENIPQYFLEILINNVAPVKGSG